MDFSREDLPQNLGKIRKQVRGRQKVGRKRPRAGDVSVVLPDCAKQKKAKSLLAGQKLEQLGAAALTTIEHEQFNYEKFPDKDDELGQLSDLFQELAIDKTIFTQLGRENGISFEKTTISSLKSEVWIPADDEKLFHNLNMTERNILKSNRWLNDKIIDSAMNLLHYQFPDLEGFQSCQLAYQLDFYKHQSTFIQIINRSISDGGSHWLTASNINCLENTIKVYDSAYDDLPHEEELLVASLVKTEATSLQVQFPNVAIQPNGYDCGVYAIANATALAYGIDPATQVYKQCDMREHLFRCLENKMLTPFGVAVTKPREISVKKVVDVPLFCVSHMPDTKTKYVFCDVCGSKFHPQCVGLNITINASTEFTCPNSRVSMMID